MTEKTTVRSLIVDNREPPWMHRMELDGARVISTQLQCGDVWLTGDDGALLIVERKTASDLVASIADGRLFDQAAAMVQLSPWSYVAIQGTLAVGPQGTTLVDGQPTQWQWSSVQGALQTVQELGVAIIYLSDQPIGFVQFLARLITRDRGNVRAGGVRKPELLAPGMLALMALPGIGADRAKALLETLAGAAWALEYLTDTNWQSDHVTGIGDGVRAKVREALSLPEGAKLAVLVDGPPATGTTEPKPVYTMEDANRELF
jgi:ERCC4-type nuclease